jgi:hypothetical protein
MNSTMEHNIMELTISSYVIECIYLKCNEKIIVHLFGAE